MKKVCLIIPYFGKLPNYFQLFLNSCAFNENFMWLVFTDDNTNFNYPGNVLKIEYTFSKLQFLVNSKFKFKVKLERPYKICDLRPAFGYIFEEYLKDYAFWGYCDVDTIMGNLNDFITDDLLNSYDKLFCLGHMTLYKNTDENNKAFMSIYRGEHLYKKVLKQEANCWFDEQWKDENNINQLFLEIGKKVYTKDLSLNISNEYNSFRRTQYLGLQQHPQNRGYNLEPYKEALYLWDKGEICRILINDGQLLVEKFPYIHLQNRKMKVDSSVLNANVFKIVPDEFLLLEIKTVTKSNFKSIKKKGFCIHLLRIKWKHLRIKINKLFHKIF